MLRRRQLRVLARVFASAGLVFAIYGAARQYAFERSLDGLQITFDDFPVDYAKVLNESVARGEQPPTEFDYASTFPNGTIPRIIHFIWFQNLYASREGATQIPSIGSHAPERCRLFNPSYEIRMWNATSARDFISTDYSWFLPTYDGYKFPIQRIDALKYFVLWHFGGVYMDLDIACRRPLDPLLEFPAWFPEASPLGVNNDLMASAPRHPIMKGMTEGLATHNHNLIFPYLTIFWTTGPHFTSTILKEYTYPERAGQTSKKDAGPGAYFILPRIFYSEEYTFFGHSPGGTWHGSDVATILWLVDHPWVMVGIFISAIGVMFGILRTRSRRHQGDRSG